MQVPGLAIKIYKAKKDRKKRKKIYIIEAIQLVERASSLHASEKEKGNQERWVESLSRGQSQQIK